MWNWKSQLSLTLARIRGFRRECCAYDFMCVVIDTPNEVTKETTVQSRTVCQRRDVLADDFGVGVTAFELNPLSLGRERAKFAHEVAKVFWVACFHGALC